jgi:NADPH:quinone reductase
MTKETLSSVVPGNMRVVEHAPGGAPDILRLGTTSVPVPGADEILIHVAVAGVNRPDIAQRYGRYPPPPGASQFMGLEVSGRVAAVGSAAASQWKVGDAVCALTNGGGYADYVTVAAGQALPVPKGLSLLQAAALPETYFTVWSNLFERGHLQAGETVLIHGGSSGIGVTAIQLAKHFGARVLCTVGSADKQAACLALGAEVAINYREEDFVERVQALTDGKGVNVILDMVGGSYVQRNFKALALEGRLVQIAFLEPSKMELDLMPLMIKRLTMTGSTLRARPNAEKARLASAVKQAVWPALEQGRVLPQIYQVFDVSEVRAAHELMESSTHIGKIMMTVNGQLLA